MSGTFQIVRHCIVNVLFSLVVLLGACDNSSDDPAPPAPPVVCKLTHQTTNGTLTNTNGTTTQNRTSTYTYDQNGNILGVSVNNKYEYSDGNKEITSSSFAYTYDDDGFLVRRVSHDTRSNKDGLTSSQMTDAIFEYKDQRLSQVNHTQTYNGTTITYSHMYEYDSEGRLIKFSSTNKDYTKFEYTGNRIQRITYVDAAGNSRSPFIEYNANGQLVKSIDVEDGITKERRYQYNAAGDLIRDELYYNGKPYVGYTYEFDDKINPGAASNSRPKGHPEFPGIQAYTGQKHNITKIVYFGGKGDAWAEGSTVVNTYQYNANNVPVEKISKSSDFGIQYASELTSFQYQDCN